MKAEFFHADYREYLHNELQARLQRRPHYSLRAFARDLQLSPSTLSELLSGRYSLSRVRAVDVAKRIQLSQAEASHFADLMMLKKNRNNEEKRLAAVRIKHRVEANKVSLDTFKIISGWHHFALLELFYLKEFQPSERWMAKALGITLKEVKESLQRLISVGFLKETTEGLKLTNDTSLVTDGVPSEAIRTFHKQILDKAIESIPAQSIQERELGASLVSVRKSDIPEMKKFIQNCLDDFEKKFSGKSERDELYCVSMQLFSLLQKKKEAKNASSTLHPIH